jgi:trehalose-phosphatase
MTRSDALDTLIHRVRRAQGLSLFLDYDGTLVPIGRRSAPTRPETAVLDLLADLAQVVAIQTVILSGRTLSSLADLLPVPGLILAGIYGLEVQIEGNKLERGPASARLRPIIARVKLDWERKVGARPGCAIEDKGLSVALHADGVDPVEAAGLMQAGRQAVADWLPAKEFRFIGGGDYLEVAPAEADKARAVDWFLDQSHRPDRLPVYFGDDANDDAAFASVRRRGGLTIGVGTRYNFENAGTIIASPAEVRAWLEQILIATR